MRRWVTCSQNGNQLLSPQFHKPPVLLLDSRFVSVHYVELQNIVLQQPSSIWDTVLMT